MEETENSEETGKTEQVAEGPTVNATSDAAKAGVPREPGPAKAERMRPEDWGSVPSPRKRRR